jgi:lipoprotein-anchoring transpeptidase ErfK/SrfK
VAIAVIGVLSGCTAAGTGTSALSSLAASGSSAAPASSTSVPDQSAGASTSPRPTPSSSTPAPPPPPPPAAVTATPANGAAGVDPLTPIAVSVTGGTLEAVTLTNPEGVDIPVAGTLAADQLSWSTGPTELGYGKTYTITTAAKNVAGVVAQTQTSFTTVVPNNKTAASSFPSNGMTVGVAQPIAIVFDEPIADRAAAVAAITVTTTPAQTGGFRWITDQEVRWRPQNFWQSGTTVAVNVDIYGKDLGDGVYGQQDMSFGFTVGRAMIAEIDDNTKTMVVSQDGQVINSIPVSLGSNKYPTYNGIHVVAEKYESKIMDSSTWGLTGTGAYRTEVGWATRISSSGEFVHSAPWSVWAQGSENVSHGCVNVAPDAAIWFYNTFIPGDPVIIKNTVGPNLEVWDGYGDFQMPFEEYVAA